MNRLNGPTRRRGDVANLARMIGVSRGSLYRWMHASERQGPRRVGRPGPSRADRRAALRAIARLYRAGFPINCRFVVRELRGRHRVRLLQQETGRFKEQHARHEERHRARARMQVAVKAPDVIWGMDGTHLGRLEDRSAVEGQLLRDAATRLTLELAVGRPASAEDVVQILERVRLRVGRLPYVLSTDNGSIYTSERVERYLEEHQVIHLLNVPRTPQHNAFTERAIREVKELAELGKGVVMASAEDAARRIERARLYLNQRHARPVLRGRTAAQCYQSDRERYRMPARELFYRTTRYALEIADLQTPARARPRARREAIYASLELFGLVSRTRGGVPFRAVMCVGIP